MGKTTLFRCQAAGCRQMVEGEWCDEHKPAEASPAPAFDVGAYLVAHTQRIRARRAAALEAEQQRKAAALEAERQRHAEEQRAAKLAKARMEHDLLREQLHLMGRVAEYRQPKFTGGADGL